MAADYFEKIENDFIKEINYVYNNNDYYVEFMAEKLLHYEDFLQMQILFRILKPFNLSKELVKEMLNICLLYTSIKIILIVVTNKKYSVSNN